MGVYKSLREYFFRAAFSAILRSKIAENAALKNLISPPTAFLHNATIRVASNKHALCDCRSHEATIHTLIRLRFTR